MFEFESNCGATKTFYDTDRPLKAKEGKKNVCHRNTLLHKKEEDIEYQATQYEKVHGLFGSRLIIYRSNDISSTFNETSSSFSLRFGSQTFENCCLFAK